MKHLLKKYFNSVLRPDEFTEVTNFLEPKKNNEEIDKLMKPFWDNELESTIEKPGTNPALFKRIKESILLEKYKVTQRKIKIYSRGLVAAAVLVGALLFGNIIFFKNSTENFYANPMQTVSTPYGAKTKVILPDGSIVWLNSGSELTYPIKFKKNRPVSLVGEAFFEVAKSGIPFIVSTEYGDVEVRGTSFNVRAFSDEDSFETTLVEGSVAFKSKNSLNEVTLKPGEQIEKIANGFHVKDVEIKYFTSWKEGELHFKKEPFCSFIKELERWYNVKIEYSDPLLNEIWYSGTIGMESISEVMEMISRAAPVTYSFDNKTRIFTIKAK